MKAAGHSYLQITCLLLLMWWAGQVCAQNEKETDSPSHASIETLVTDTISLDSLALKAITDSLMLHLTPAKAATKFTPDPIRATWIALVFPGGGQIYNRKYWKLPIIYGGFLGCTYALTWNNMMLHDYQQAYLDIMDTDPNTKSYEKMLPIGYDITGREERFQNIFKNKKNHFRKYRDMSIFAFAGVYLISIIDAYVDAELSTFDISEDLSLHFEPTSIETGWRAAGRGQTAFGLQCCLSF